MFKVKRISSGATKNNAKSVTRFEFPWLISSIVIFLGITAFFISKIEFKGALENVDNAFTFPLTNVVVECEFEFVSKSVVTNILQSSVSHKFLDLDLVEIKKRLENQAWIEHVNVKREWQNTLRIEITEEQPIAQWADNGFINKNGDIIEIAEKNSLNHLPIFLGDETKVDEITRWFANFKATFSSHGLKINMIKVSELGTWMFRVNDKISIFVDNDEKNVKM